MAKPISSHQEGRAKPRPHLHPPQRRKRISVTSIVILGIVIATAVTAVLMFGIPQHTAGPQAENPAPNVQIGRVVEQTDNGECTIAEFDNATGRQIDVARHCENAITLDAHGMPVPVGTIHRLDSISKSFRGGADH